MKEENLIENEFPAPKARACTWTIVDNVLLDYWQCRLNPEVFSVLIALVRKTYGCRIPDKSISVSDFMKITGLSRRTVQRSITFLVSKGFIEKEKIGKPGNEECFFSIKFKNGKVN